MKTRILNLALNSVREKILLMKCIESASFSRQVLSSHKRKTGENLFCHPYRMFQKSIQYGVYDEVILHSIFLHDVVEDTAIEVIDIERKFGPYIAWIVKGMTCLDDQKNKLTKNDYFSKFAFFCVMDWRILIVKMLDCIDNLETLGGLSAERRSVFVREKREIYLPIFEKHFHQIPQDLRKNYECILFDLQRILVNLYE